MTDARFPEQWLNDRRVVRLSQSAFRTFVTTLTWSVSNRTEGVIELDDLDLINGAVPRDSAELDTSGLWFATGERTFLITVFRDTQTSREQLEAAECARRKERDKKRGQRARAASVPGDVPGDNTGQARTGQDRTGASITTTEVEDGEAAEALDDYRRGRARGAA